MTNFAVNHLFRADNGDGRPGHDASAARHAAADYNERRRPTSISQQSEGNSAPPSGSAATSPVRLVIQLQPFSPRIPFKPLPPDAPACGLQCIATVFYYRS
jgi:hypothetical protein